MSISVTRSPAKPTQEVVPYHPPARVDTRSQVQRRERADAGDLQARLDLIPLETVEHELARHFRSARPDCSLLACLEGADDDHAASSAAALVLEELAEDTEQAGLKSALVYRYVQAHALWRDHPSPDVVDAQSFLDTLARSDYVKMNILVGSSTYHAKQARVQAIDRAWGSGWYEKIPEELRNPQWTRASDCSRAMLGEIAANVRHEYTFEQALDGWTAAMRRRTDEAMRREHGIKRQPRFPYFVPYDARSMNQEQASGRSQAPVDDRLRVELVAPTSPPSAPARPRPGRAAKSRKRKRGRATLPTDADAGDDGDVEGGWRMAADGKATIKKVRNLWVRKPIPDGRNASPSALLASQLDSSPRTSAAPVSPNHDPPSSQPDELASTADATSLTCDGPGVALVIRKFFDAFGDLRSVENGAGLSSRCCDRCRPVALDALQTLSRVLIPCAEALEDVQSHRVGGEEVQPSQIDDVSPRKNRTAATSPFHEIPNSSADST